MFAPRRWNCLVIFNWNAWGSLRNGNCIGYFSRLDNVIPSISLIYGKNMPFPFDVHINNAPYIHHIDLGLQVNLNAKSVVGDDCPNYTSWITGRRLSSCCGVTYLHVSTSDKQIISEFKARARRVSLRISIFSAVSVKTTEESSGSFDPVWSL